MRIRRIRLSIMSDAEIIGKLIRQAYMPVSSPPGVREQILGRLMAEIGYYPKVDSNKVWGRPRLMVPILASIAAGFIIYGCILSTSWL